MSTRIHLLKKKTSHRLATLRQDMVRKFKNECLALFHHKGAADLPILLYAEALERNFGEKEIAVLEKSRCASKQKISINVGAKRITIGEYDAQADGDLLEYVSSECVKKRVNNKLF